MLAAARSPERPPDPAVVRAMESRMATQTHAAGPDRKTSSGTASDSTPAAPGQRCDFCGDRVVAVRRVALDREYDRLQKAHREQYACASCFEDKEQRRLGLLRR